MRTNLLTEARQYQRLRNVQQVNASLSNHIREHFSALTKGIRKVLDTIAKHSCRVPGVSWLKIDTLAALAEVSRSTVERALRTLEKLGIIRREFRIVEGEGQRCSFIVINQSPQVLHNDKAANKGAVLKGRSDADKPTDTSIETTSSQAETNSFKSKKDDDIDTNSLPASADPFFVSELTEQGTAAGLSKRDIRKIIHTIGDRLYSMPALQSALDIIARERKYIHVIHKYFVTVIDNEQARLEAVMAEQLRRRHRQQQAIEFPFYNWLEA